MRETKDGFLLGVFGDEKYSEKHDTSFRGLSMVIIGLSV